MPLFSEDVFDPPITLYLIDIPQFKLIENNPIIKIHFDASASGDFLCTIIVAYPPKKLDIFWH